MLQYQTVGFKADIAKEKRLNETSTLLMDRVIEYGYVKRLHISHNKYTYL